MGLEGRLPHLDAGDDALLLDELHEGGAVISLLVHSFVEEDHSGDVFRNRLQTEALVLVNQNTYEQKMGEEWLSEISKVFP